MAAGFGGLGATLVVSRGHEVSGVSPFVSQSMVLHGNGGAAATDVTAKARKGNRSPAFA